MDFLNTFVTTTAFKYLVTMIATYFAAKLGIDQGSITAILTQLVGVVMLIWGAWESSRKKVVTEAGKVEVKELPKTLQTQLQEAVTRIVTSK